MKQAPSYILPLIIISQFAGTSLWFVGNAILPELKLSMQLSTYAVSQVTAAVQFGFVAGTLIFAVLSIADRFSASRTFFISCCLAAVSNVCVALFADDAVTLMTLRFITGFFLAGIYPVGMKMAADWYGKRPGIALGFLVGALVLGTAFPHLLSNRDFQLPWRTILYSTSFFAFAGGVLIWIAGDPGRTSLSPGIKLDAGVRIFREKRFRSAALGYFGHMWELYTFWGFVPLMLQLYNQLNGINLNVSVLSFLVIGIGFLSCIGGGYLSRIIGNARVAAYALVISGFCCVLSPLMFDQAPAIFISFLLVWGLAVIADSPQFSTLVALTAPPELKGTALTFTTSVGFAITMVSLIVTDRIFHAVSAGGSNTFLILAAGPVFGLLAMVPILKKEKKKGTDP